MKKYLIIGERCQDRFVYGKSNRLSPEAPIPIFSPISEVKTLGMAMNVYNNLKAMISSGTDKVSYVVSKAASVKTRFVDDKTNHYFLRVDSEEKYDRIQFSEKRLKQIREADCIIISDYNKGFLMEEDILLIRKLNKKVWIFLDTKKIVSKKMLDAVNFLKMNLNEWKNNMQNENFKKFVFTKRHSKIIVTLGDEGAMYNGELFETREVVKTLDVSGAGDTFLAGLAFSFINIGDIKKSIDIANSYASDVVKKRGVSCI
jgi:D-beta-D-heptose 7-phosphate kinase/D-beta-D-heptose 1-phosphate adenosyltransferase